MAAAASRDCCFAPGLLAVTLALLLSSPSVADGAECGGGAAVSVSAGNATVLAPAAGAGYAPPFCATALPIRSMNVSETRVAALGRQTGPNMLVVTVSVPQFWGNGPSAGNNSDLTGCALLLEVAQEDCSVNASVANASNATSWRPVVSLLELNGSLPVQSATTYSVPFLPATGCGVNATSIATSTNAGFRIRNTGSAPQCWVSVQVVILDACSARGDLIASSEAVPAVDTAIHEAGDEFCVCDFGYHGPRCESLSTTVPTNGSSVEITTSVTFPETNLSRGFGVAAPIDPTFALGFRNVKFVVSHQPVTNDSLVTASQAAAINAACRDATVFITYSCGDGCLPQQVQYDTSGYARHDEDRELPGYPLDSGETTVAYDQFADEVLQTFCGCTSGDLRGMTWFIEVRHEPLSPTLTALRNDTCRFSVTPALSFSCPRGDADFNDDDEVNYASLPICSGKGVCGIGGCSCDDDRTLFDCSDGEIAEYEAYNGVIVPKVFSPEGNAIYRFFTEVGFTNEALEITMNAVDISSEAFQEALGKLTSDDDSSEEDKELFDDMQMRVFIGIGQEPEISVKTTTMEYPKILVTADLIDAEEDVFLESNASALRKEPLTIDLTKFKDPFHAFIYIVVVPTGTFDIERNLPVNVTDDQDLQVLLLLVYTDSFITVIDVALLIILVVFLFLFCVTYKLCPTCHEGLMSRVVPELYVMKIAREKKQEKDSKINADAAKLLQGYTVKELLDHIIDSVQPCPSVEIPSADLDLQSLLRLLTQVIDLGKFEVERFDALDGYLHPAMLTKALGAWLQRVAFDVEMKVPSGDIQADKLIEEIEENLPDDVLAMAVELPVMDPLQLLRYMENFVVLPGFKKFTAPLDANLKPKRLPLLVHPPTKLSLENMVRICGSTFQRFKVPVSPQLSAVLTNFLEGVNFDIADATLLGDVKVDLRSAVRVRRPSCKVDLSNVDIPEVVHQTVRSFTLNFLQQIFFAILGSFFILFLEALTLLFNVSMMHAMFLNLGVDNMPDIETINAELVPYFGPFTGVTLLFSGFFIYLDYQTLMNLAVGFNCGGLLTLLSPFVFLLGCALLWVVLQKDLVLLVGVRLKLLQPGGKFKGLKQKLYVMLSRLFTRLALLTLQAVLFVFAQTLVQSQTLKTCGDWDLVSNTAGKVLVGIYYLFFYVMVSFIFTGAPNMEKYEDLAWYMKYPYMFADGIARLLEITAGVWSDATIRAYNVLPRARRYAEKIPPGVPHALNPQVQGKGDIDAEAKDTLHEQVMLLLSQTRGLIFIPVPFGPFICKLGEAMNQAQVLIFLREEQVKLRRPFISRIITWGVKVSQFFMMIAFVLTANPVLAGIMSTLLLPSFFLRLADDLGPAFNTFRGNLRDHRNLHDYADDIELNAGELKGGAKEDQLKALADSRQAALQNQFAAQAKAAGSVAPRTMGTWTSGAGGSQVSGEKS